MARRPSTATVALTAFFLAAPILAAPQGKAQQTTGGTYLLDLYAGSSRSRLADELGRGSYELTDGTPVDLNDWYSSRWRDTTILFLTQLNKDTGLLWGLGTGERGAKYAIEPALHLGLIRQFRLSRDTWLTFTAAAVIGGNLTERSCTADYGAIGGVQRVNCRLAAEPIPPSETLRYLARQSGHDESRISVVLEHRF